ncbi:hypothetical protein VB773_20050, partial [Haloarculaceae archaeon H-GB2-1]|nr:hypothetical protein [Haloarculaceae archaeon H-GB2-1]
MDIANRPKPATAASTDCQQPSNSTAIYDGPGHPLSTIIELFNYWHIVALRMNHAGKPKVKATQTSLTILEEIMG